MRGEEFRTVKLSTRPIPRLMPLLSILSWISIRPYIVIPARIVSAMLTTFVIATSKAHLEETTGAQTRGSNLHPRFSIFFNHPSLLSSVRTASPRVEVRRDVLTPFDVTRPLV